MRYIWVWWILVGWVWAQESIEARLHATSRELAQIAQIQESTRLKLEATMIKIVHGAKVVSAQERYIQQLELRVRQHQARYLADKGALRLLLAQQHQLQEKQDALEIQLVGMLSQHHAMLLLGDAPTRMGDDVIAQEIIRRYASVMEKTIHRLNLSFLANQKKMHLLVQQSEKVRRSIIFIERETQMLYHAKRQREAQQMLLNKEEKTYKKALNHIAVQAEYLSQSLAQLHGEKEKIEASMGYYRGEKTIAPLAKYRLVRRFGTYTDPIYRIRVQNQSVTLAPTQDNRVRTILEGRIVLMTNTPLLGNVIVIEHKEQLHSIYAHIDVMAPMLTQGMDLPKGSIIGRAQKELLFQVTQNSTKIDPMSIIH